MLEALRSSPRKLARVFQKGRDAWKERAQQQQRRAKKLDGKVADLTRSRDRWKAKAKQLEQQLRDLEAAKPSTDSADTENVTPVQAVARPVSGSSAAPPFCPLPNDRTFLSI
jgi:septal ring factor EnvC (AmiA/AmiB activator)